MKKATDAVRLLNKVINDLINDDIEVDKARTLVYAASILAKCYETADMERRLEELEKKNLSAN
jgi:hypothetical protein